eukprot:2806267-Rhodomonas_salina.3
MAESFWCQGAARRSHPPTQGMLAPKPAPPILRAEPLLTTPRLRLRVFLHATRSWGRLLGAGVKEA